jgi:hypothetical protein
MTIAFTQIPDSVAAGAQVTFTMSTAKSVSESGNSGRKLLRPIKRNYLVTLSPDDSAEMQAIIMAARGDRYPVAIRDYTAYTLQDELCEVDPVTNDFLIGKTWEPETGDLSVFERILIPESIVVKINGSTATTGTVTQLDFGRLHIPSAATGDDVTVTGTYLRPIALLDAPAATAYGNIGGVVQYQFSSMRFEELFEAELEALFGT